MTGPEHYAEAQWLLAQVTRPSAISPNHHVLLPSDFPGDSPADVIALAQVHATLAGVYAHNRATTELTGLLHAMLDQIREAREAVS